VKQWRTVVTGLIVVAIAGRAAWWLASPPRLLEAQRRATIAVGEPTPELSAPIAVRREETPPLPVVAPIAPTPAPTAADSSGEKGRSVGLGARLFGRVISAKDQSPLRDVVIGVPASISPERSFERSTIALDEVDERTRTDERGRFRLDAGRAADVLEATTPGFGPLLFESSWLGVTEENELVIPLAAAAVFKGRETDRLGVPQGDVELRLAADGYAVVPPSGRLSDALLMRSVVWRETTDAQNLVTFSWKMQPLVSQRPLLREDFLHESLGHST